jgi:hypothetical protein
LDFGEVNGGFIRLIGAGQSCGIGNFGNAPLAQDIKLSQADVFGRKHVKMDGWVSFGR